jgi:hypothetical protein
VIPGSDVVGVPKTGGGLGPKMGGGLGPKMGGRVVPTGVVPGPAVDEGDHDGWLVVDPNTVVVELDGVVVVV